MSSTILTQPAQELLPFNPPPSHRSSRRKKRGADRRSATSSIEAFEALKRRRTRLYLFILQVIAAHGPQPYYCVTARQILRELKRLGVLAADAERNDVSPRISELFDAGCLENPPDPLNPDLPYLKRGSSDATALTWRLTPRGRELLAHLASVRDRVRSGGQAQ